MPIVFGERESPKQLAALRERLAYQNIRNTTLDDETRACGCVGPQPGQTKCPCALRAESRQGRRMIDEGVVIDGVPYKLVRA